MFLNNSPLLSKEWLAVGVIGNRWHLNISSVLPCLSAYSASFYFHLHCSIHHSTPCFGHTVLSPCSKSFRPTEQQSVWPAGATVGLSANRGTRWRTWPNSWRHLWKAAQATGSSTFLHCFHHPFKPQICIMSRIQKNQYPRRIIISLANQTRSTVKLIPFHVNLTIRLKQNIKNWIEWWFQHIANYVFLHSLNIYYSELQTGKCFWFFVALFLFSIYVWLFWVAGFCKNLKTF